MIASAIVSAGFPALPPVAPSAAKGSGAPAVDVPKIAPFGGQRTEAREAAPRSPAERPREDNKSETTEAIEARQASAGSQPRTRLSIIFHQDSGVFVSRSVDKETGEVIAQFPAEQTIRRIAAFAEGLRQQQTPPPQVDVLV